MIEKLKEILRAYLGEDIADIGPDSVLADDLGLDSMELFELVSTIEEQFGIEIPDRMLLKFVTVQDVVEYLEKAA